MSALETEIKNISDAVQKLQEVQDGKFKQHEGAREEQEKRLEKMICDFNELAQKQAALETAFNRPGAAEKSSEEEVQELSAAFKKYAAKGEGGLTDAELKTLSVGSDPDGGYRVTPQMSQTIVGRVFESSPIRQLATIETISTDTLEMPIDDDETSSGGWVGESDTRSTTGTPEVGVLKIPVHEMYENPKATQKLLDDANFNVEQWLGNKVADRFGRREATGFVSGTGVNAPTGILSYSAWAVAGTYERFKLEQINSGAAGEFTADGLIDIQTALIEAYQANASWLMRRASFGAIRKLKDGDGQYLLGVGMGLDKKPQLTLLDKPVYYAADMPAVGSGNLAAAYGDFRAGYTIVDRIGIRVLRDPYSAKPFIQFYTTKRVGGAVTNFEAIKLHKLSA